MYSEDDLLPLSALQHLLFCERQCALIHLENAWHENRLTVEGHHLHERVHEQAAESRPGIRIVRGLRLRSLQLGLAGIADVVEFHLRSQTSDITPFPVEYKRGKPKNDDCDRVQLCAQAMCLEEMLGCSVPSGALFYGLSRRRQEVDCDGALRDLTTRTAARLHALLSTLVTPPAIYDSKCDNCSLKDLCLPKEAGGGHSVGAYLERCLQSEI